MRETSSGSKIYGVPGDVYDRRFLLGTLNLKGFQR